MATKIKNDPAQIVQAAQDAGTPVDELLELTESAYWFVRRSAVVTLEEIATSTGTPVEVLEKLADCPVRSVSTAARVTLTV